MKYLLLEDVNGIGKRFDLLTLSTAQVKDLVSSGRAMAWTPRLRARAQELSWAVEDKTLSSPAR